MRKPWSEYPIGTRAFAIGGGYWHKTDRGWQWTLNGSTFPTPGADVLKVVEPKKALEECPNCHQESLIVVGGGQGCMMCSHTFSYTQ